jgi:hypothetical protein
MFPRPPAEEIRKKQEANNMDNLVGMVLIIATESWHLQ